MLTTYFAVELRCQRPQQSLALIPSHTRAAGVLDGVLQDAFLPVRMAERDCQWQRAWDAERMLSEVYYIAAVVEEAFGGVFTLSTVRTAHIHAIVPVAARHGMYSCSDLVWQRHTSTEGYQVTEMSSSALRAPGDGY